MIQEVERVVISFKILSGDTFTPGSYKRERRLCIVPRGSSKLERVIKLVKENGHESKTGELKERLALHPEANGKLSDEQLAVVAAGGEGNPPLPEYGYLKCDSCPLNKRILLANYTKERKAHESANPGHSCSWNFS